ncbi:MAG TPA: hypothetical protein VFE95_06040 [Pseudomonas sp.]|nr:hypothetical protein [Pseudomonas sp.]
MADSKPINWAYPFKSKAAAEGETSQGSVTAESYYDALAKAKDGYYPMGTNGLWHGGIHFDDGTAASLDQSAIHCIADGEVIAYRIDQRYPTTQYGEGPTVKHLPFSTSFVLVKHRLELPPVPSAPAAEAGETEEAAPASSALTFYSLYMHLADWASYSNADAPPPPAFFGETLYSVKPDKASDGVLGSRVRAAPKDGAVTALLPKGTKVKVGDVDAGSPAWRKLLSILEGSAIPALTGEELGWVYTSELQAVAGEADTFLVADDAKDKEATLAPQPGLNVRKAANSGSLITGLLPVGAKFSLKAGTAAYRELQQIVEGQDIAPLSANSVHNIQGFVHFASLQASQAVPTLDTVHLLPQPYPIKAGDLVGHFGKYQNFDDARPRAMLHLEVFTSEDAPAFIARSRAVGEKLPAEQKTLIKVDKGSKIIQPAAADGQIETGTDVCICSDSPKAGRWAKVRKYAICNADKSTELGRFNNANATYPLNITQKATLAARMGIDVADMPDQVDFLKVYFNSVEGGDAHDYDTGTIPTTHPWRKVGAAVGEPVWVERSNLNTQGQRTSTAGALAAWSAFPLHTRIEGQPCGYARILPAASWDGLPDERKAIDPDKVHWWYVTVGDLKGNDISGWAAEKDLVVSRHSPWEWPGFSTIQDKLPLDAHLARTLDATGRTTEEEAQGYAALIEEAERGEILSELYDVIDLPDEKGTRDKKLTPAELKAALGKPWLAQQLSLLISQHESEWFWNEGKWNQLDKLMDHTPADPNSDWVAEKGRIKALSWWKELAGQPGIAADGVAWHFHPTGTIGCFYKSDTNLITMEMLQITKPSSDSSYYEEILPYLNEYAVAYEVNTPIRIAHFLAQVGHESGFRVRSEDGDYSATRMREIFGCVGGKKNYNKATDECSLGRLRDKLWTDETTYANNPRKLLSFVYSSRMGNGDEASEEGYKFRGRGIIQLTGKNNYRKYTEIHNSATSSDVKDFVENPDLIITTIKYGVESGFVYWAMVNANKIADADNSERLTIAINGGLNGYDERIECLEKLKAHMGL